MSSQKSVRFVARTIGSDMDRFARHAVAIVEPFEQIAILACLAAERRVQFGGRFAADRAAARSLKGSIGWCLHGAQDRVAASLLQASPGAITTGLPVRLPSISSHSGWADSRSRIAEVTCSIMLPVALSRSA